MNAVPAGRPGKAVRLTRSTCRCGGKVHLSAAAGYLGRPQSPTKGQVPPALCSSRRLLGALKAQEAEDQRAKVCGEVRLISKDGGFLGLYVSFLRTLVLPSGPPGNLFR